MLKTSSNRFAGPVVCLAASAVAACSPSPQDTAALIKVGDARACSTPEVRANLQGQLTPFLAYRKLKPSLDGKSLANFGFVFDPIVSTSAQDGRVECAAAGYLSLDGKAPFSSNQVQLQYSLATNLNDDSEFVLQGRFADALRTTFLLYENSGVLEEGRAVETGNTL